MPPKKTPAKKKAEGKKRTKKRTESYSMCAPPLLFRQQRKVPQLGGLSLLFAIRAFCGSEPCG